MKEFNCKWFWITSVSLKSGVLRKLSLQFEMLNTLDQFWRIFHVQRGIDTFTNFYTGMSEGWERQPTHFHPFVEMTMLFLLFLANAPAYWNFCNFINCSNFKITYEWHVIYSLSCKRMQNNNFFEPTNENTSLRLFLEFT